MDHAVFHALFVSGYRVYVMLAALAHDSTASVACRRGVCITFFSPEHSM